MNNKCDINEINKKLKNMSADSNLENNEKIILATAQFVKETLADSESGHDWWHIYRVWNLSKKLSENEDVDILVVELGALLHDIADSKFHDGDETIGPKKARIFLESLKVDEKTIIHVENIIKYISFKGGQKNHVFKSKELDLVQDADRIDAIGAIGIARAFSYGGFKKRPIYVPGIKPKNNMTPEEYRNSKSHTINHFYEKLLLLKDLMNTKAGKKLAESRTEFMLKFLDEFYCEWNQSSSDSDKYISK